MALFVSLRQAVADLVHDGDSVALEGFAHLIPFAAGHEIIRQQRRTLTLIRMTPDLLYDQMIGSACARKRVFSWGGNPGVGTLHRLRDAVEHHWPHPLEIEEYTHAAMAHAYAAGAAGMPSAFFRGCPGTDLPAANPNIRIVACPFTGEPLTCAGPSPGRRHRSRAAGRPARQRAAQGHHRRGGTSSSRSDSPSTRRSTRLPV